MNAPAPHSGTFRIIILDDNPSTSGLSKAALERHLGCSVTLCHSAAALLEASRQRAPDLFLLEVSPGHDGGVELCRRLKLDPATAEIPIIFLSAYKEPAKRVAALQAGGADYIDKPFYPEELVARVRHHAEMHRLRLENQAKIAEQHALLRVLCHDLVNPLFGAHSLLDLKMETGKVDERTLRLVLSCCRSAMDIIENVREQHQLLAVDKQSEKPPEKQERVALEDAVAESARSLAAKFSQKDVRLETDLRGPAVLPISKVSLAHNILSNLLTNALKFSHRGSMVMLRSRLVSAGAQRLCVIEIEDRGIGMPPDILRDVFKENAKVSRSGTSDEKGTGFGMPLVKRYVEKGGGTVAIESREADPKNPALRSGTIVRLAFPVVG